VTILRTAAAGVVAAVVGLAPFGAAMASGDSSTVQRLAEQAAAIAAEEIDLLTPSASQSGFPDAEAALRAIDLQGQELLRQLESRGIELSEPIRVSLALLPAPGSGAVPPPAVVYAAAISDLERLAATPDAYRDSTRETQSSFGLLIVAAAALVVFVTVGLKQLRRPHHHDELTAMAWSDGLTGVANRRRLDHDLVGHSAIASGPTAVIMLDVDRFKVINDTYGHVVGDRILRDLGRVLAESVRQGDVVYRYGGEEFCVLLPNASQDEAAHVADRIVAAVHAVQLPDGSHITVSAGVADGDASSIEHTLECADQAMLSAKQTGRDRVASADVAFAHA
jgi:diguanylate cyclase (GGDEF)-like protein